MLSFPTRSTLPFLFSVSHRPRCYFTRIEVNKKKRGLMKNRRWTSLLEEKAGSLLDQERAKIGKHKYTAEAQ
jgi:hypothetical protein